MHVRVPKMRQIRDAVVRAICAVLHMYVFMFSFVEIYYDYDCMFVMISSNMRVLMQF